MLANHLLHSLLLFCRELVTVHAFYLVFIGRLYTITRILIFLFKNKLGWCAGPCNIRQQLQQLMMEDSALVKVVAIHLAN